MPATVSETNTRITFTIGKDLKAKAEERAKIEKRSLSNLITIALDEYLNNTNKNQ